MHSLYGNSDSLRHQSRLRDVEQSKLSDVESQGIKKVLQKKGRKNFGISKICITFAKFFRRCENRSEPRAAQRSIEEIPENIERVTIDKDKKVQELKK